MTSTTLPPVEVLDDADVIEALEEAVADVDACEGSASTIADGASSLTAPLWQQVGRIWGTSGTSSVPA